MSSVTFMKNKIARQIKMNGQHFCIWRYVLDKRHQQTNEREEVAEFDGLFHEVTSWFALNGAAPGLMVKKPRPMILALCDAQTEKLACGDRLKIRDVEYKVVAKDDVKQLGVAYDISLEVIV